MDISKEKFFFTAANLGIPQEQIEALWDSLEAGNKRPATSPFSRLIFSFGAMMVICAMAWLMGINWERLGGGGIFLISIAYAALFTFLGAKLWKKEAWKIPAGLLITMAVCMVPLAIIGLETYLKLWPADNFKEFMDYYRLIHANLVFVEVGTIVAGLIALKFFPFPFITAPIFLASWYLTMDLVPLMFRQEDLEDKSDWISLCFGFGLILISYVIDRMKMKEYSFWGYIFGVMIFWGFLTKLCWDKGEAVMFLYLMINLLMMVSSILLKSRVFIIFGTFGTLIYFIHLADDIFANSLLFPFSLSFLGLLIIYLGILYQKNSNRIEKKIFELFPAWFTNFFN